MVGEEGESRWESACHRGDKERTSLVKGFAQSGAAETRGSDRLTYRILRDSDLPALQQLWEGESSWGPLTPETWKRLFDSPFLGPSLVVVAANEQDEIVGQLAFMPSRVTVGGKETTAVRPFAYILSKTLRSWSPVISPGDHPFSRMYACGVQEVAARGDGLLYALPHPALARLLRLFSVFQSAVFPYWSVPLPLERPHALAPGCDVGPLQTWDSRVDELWDSASRLHRCSVVRDSRMLAWKLGQAEGNGYRVTAVERRGRLIGLAASRLKPVAPGHRQWEICDVLSADSGPSLEATLRAAVNEANAVGLESQDDVPEESRFVLRKAAILVTPVFEPVLRGLGLRRDRYTFPLVVHRVSPALADEDVAPEHWYLSAND